MSRFPSLAALLLFIVASPAAARPFTVDDLVRVESLGGAWLAPGGRWLVIERTAPHDSAKTYDDDVFETFALSRLEIVDLAGPGVAAPLLPGDDGDGVNPGPFSPSGRTMAVFRLRGHAWELGLADLASRQVRWLGLTVEPANWGRSVQWRSDDELVAIAMAGRDQPGRINRVWAAEARPVQRWAAASAGTAPTDTVVGSGRFLSLTPHGPRTELVRIDARAGAAQVLARGAFIDLELSRDGRYVAALGEEAPHQPRPGDVLRTGSTEYRRGLTLAELDTGAVTHPCGDLDLASHLLAWSPTGDRLLVFGRPDGEDWSSGTLRDVDARADLCAAAPMPGLRPAIVYPQLEGFPIVLADWMGDDPIVLSQSSSAGEAGRRDWRRLPSEGDPVNLTAALATAPQALLAVNPSGLLFTDGEGTWRVDRVGRATHLSDRFNRGVSAVGPGDGDRLQYVAAHQEYAWVHDGTEIARASADGTDQAQRLPPAAQPLVAAPGLVVSKVTDAHGVSTLLAQQGGDARQLLQVNKGYADIAFSEPMAIPFTSPGGEVLTAWLYLPPDLPAAAKAPLVVVPYPGSVYPTPPHAYEPGSTFTEVSPHVLTAAGYAVLVPSMPRDWSSHEPAAGLADQVLAAVDAAAKLAPIDPARLALWGHSYGGYAALAIATETDRFRAVIEAAGKSDLISAYGPFIPASRSAPEDGTSSIPTMGWMENGQGNLGVGPAQDVELYARNSPALRADRVTAPVLMIHGDMDFVPLAQGEEMFSALYRQHKDAVLVTLWGEGHTATSPANIRKMYAWILWWLDQTVGPGSDLGGQDRRPVARPGFDGEKLDQPRGEIAP